MIISTSITSLIIQLIAAITGVLLARYMGPQLRGDLAIILLWPMLISNIGLLGAHMELGRLSANNNSIPEKLHVVGMKHAFTLGIPLTLVTVFAIPIVFHAKYFELIGPSQFAACAIPFCMWSINQARIELGAGRYKNYNIFRSIYTSIFFISTTFVLLVINITLINLTAAYIVAVILSAIIPCIFFLNRISTVEIGCRVPSVDSVFRSSLPYGAAIILIVLSGKLDVIIIGILLSNSDIGIYVVAVTVSSIHSSLGYSFAVSLFSISAGDNGARREAASRIADKFRQAVVFYLASTIALFIVLPPLVPIIFGDEYIASAKLASILIPVISIKSIGVALEEILNGMGIPRIVIRTRTISITILFFSAFLFVPILGLSGLAISILLSSTIEITFYLVTLSKYFDIKEMLKLKTEDIWVVFNIPKNIKQSWKNLF